MDAYMCAGHVHNQCGIIQCAVCANICQFKPIFMYTPVLMRQTISLVPSQSVHVHDVHHNRSLINTHVLGSLRCILHNCVYWQILCGENSP